MERLLTLSGYSEGHQGTRDTIDRLGLVDYAELVIELMDKRLKLPKPRDTPLRQAYVERARAILQRPTRRPTARLRRQAALSRAPSCRRDDFDPVNVTIIVADASPLVTLAAAEGLDHLLYPAVPVIVPDAVFHEAITAAEKLGAAKILPWYRAHRDLVRVEPTQALRDQIPSPRDSSHMPRRDAAERATGEMFGGFRLPANIRVLLLSDDRDVARFLEGGMERIIPLATWDYLCQLEEAKRIPSAEGVVDALRRAGLNPPGRRVPVRFESDFEEIMKSALAARRRRRKPKS